MSPARKLSRTLSGSPEVLVLAHQGLHDRHPPNSLASFEAALRAGADGVELDVVSAADGTPMVFHDEILDNLTAEKGPVIERSAAQLQQIPLKWSTDQTIPTLREVLERFGGKMILWIEIKKGGPRENGLELRAAELVRALGLADTTLLSSFEWSAVRNVIDHYPDLNAAFEVFKAAYVRTLPSAYHRRLTVSYRHPAFNREEYYWANLKFNGISVFTPNEPEDLKRVIRDGATLIQTDRPELAKKLLNEGDEG